MSHAPVRHPAAFAAFRMVPAAALAVGLLAAAPATVGRAQGFVWTAPASGNWSAGTNWAGNVAPPAGGGSGVTLTFTTPTPAGYTATNDLGSPFLLNQLSFDTRYGYQTGGGTVGAVLAGGTLQFTGPAATLNVAGGAAAAVNNALDLAAPLRVTGPAAAPGDLNLFLNGAVSGGAGNVLTLNRPGPGQLILAGANTFAGGVVLNAGNLALGNAAGLGTGTLTINGPGTVRMDVFASPGGIVVPNPVVANADLVFTGNNSGNFAGVISGAGGVANAPATGINLRLLAANTYTGATTVSTPPTGSVAGTVALQGPAGSATASSGFTVGRFGNLSLDNRNATGGTGSNHPDRIGDTAPVTLQRGSLNLFGNENAASAETIGALRVGGFSFVSLTPAAGQSATLTAAGLERVDRGTVVFRGTALGSAAPGTAGTSNVLLANAAPVVAALVGGGGAAGTTTVSILPYAAAQNTAGGTGNSLATYTAANGFRPLDYTTEYATTITSGVATADNVRLLVPLAGLNADTTVNALVLDRAGTGAAATFGAVAGTGTLRVASGTILAAGPTTTGNTNVNRVDVGTLDFGAREAVVIAPELLTVSSNLTGSGGLTKAGGSFLTLTGNNAGLSGPLTILGGNVSVANVAANLPGTGAVTLSGGSLNFTGTGADTLARPVVLGGANGFVDVPNAAATLSATGAISGAGPLVKGGAGTLVLAATDSTFSGNVVVSAGTLAFSSAANLGNSAGIVLNPGGTLRNTAAATVSQPVTLLAGGGTRTLETLADLTLTGPVGQNGTPTNALPLTKTGAGALNLNAANTFNGTLNVNAGLVRVNGSLAPLNAAGPGVTVAANAGLGGVGTIRRDVSLLDAAFLSPGAAAGNVGTLTVDAALTLGGSLFYDVDVAASGAADRVDVAGLIAFNGGTITLRLNDLGASGTFNGAFTLLTAGGISGTLPGFAFDFTNAPGLADDNLQVLRSGNSFVVVPEPGTNALLLAAGAILAGLGWRHRTGIRRG